jgi:serine/threonine protein kinase
VAVKHIKNTSGNVFRQDHIAMFTKEASILSNLMHTNIVKLLNVRITDTNVQIMMEYVAAGSLLKNVCCPKRAHNQLLEPAVQSYLRQLLRGLAYAHGQGIIHRDIKPANLLLSHQGELKISDFGSAKITSEIIRDENPTMHITPLYMAPEYYQKVSTYTSKMDIWSAGCVCIYMTTGLHPWAEQQLTNRMHAMMYISRTDDIPTLPRVSVTGGAHTAFPADPTQPVAYSALLLNLLTQMLQKDPTLRPSAAELLQHAFFQLAFDTTAAAQEQSVVLDSPVLEPAFPLTAFGGDTNAETLDLDATGNSI